ncbi:hypothetical protein RF179_22535, partial [Serratia marcescens]|uniref:hypothetical protein n=1 Tax=Serratia marcescens TaxID=615 RepID=UPI002812D91B
TTTPSFEQLDDFFEKETRVYRKNQSNPGNAQKAKQQQSRTYVTQDGKGQLECFLCSKNHVATECDVFLGNEDREKLLRRNHVCIYCVS